jgi:hypothetical protein
MAGSRKSVVIELQGSPLPRITKLYTKACGDWADSLVQCYQDAGHCSQRAGCAGKVGKAENVLRGFVWTLFIKRTN